MSWDAGMCNSLLYRTGRIIPNDGNVLYTQYRILYSEYCSSWQEAAPNGQTPEVLRVLHTV